jgi:SAM-dependent methyltransferase
MKDHDELELAVAAARDRYSNPARYHANDRWHDYTAKAIRQELARRWESLPTTAQDVVLNAGAGNSDLGLCSPLTINLDLSECGVSDLPNAVVASIESIPLASNSVDAIVCVGSVINYCDAASAISEFGRILKPGGALVLEFESSRSAELLFERAYGVAAGIASTFYADEPEVLWVYAPEYVRRLLSAADIDVVESVPIHVLSPWAFRITGDANKAARLAPLDRLCRFVPGLSRWASNHLVFCQKKY